MPTNLEPPIVSLQEIQQMAGALGYNVRPANNLSEYVTGGSNNRSWTWLESLPTPDDDLDNLIGNDVYTRMGNDEQVQSSTMLLIMMALRRPLTLDPAFADRDESDEDFKMGLEVRDFCQRALDNLGKHRGSLFRFHFEMLYNAMRFGNSVAEITYERGSGEDANKLVFKCIKVKQRHALAFVVDYFWNHLGFTAYRGPYTGWLGEMKRVLQVATGSTMVGSEELNAKKAPVNDGENKEKAPPLWEFLPRDKFAVLSLLTENNDPRGRSWWRCTYNAWQQKMRRLKQLDSFARRFGEPIVVGEVAPNASDQHPLDGNGNEDRTQPKVAPQFALLQALIQMKAGDALAVAEGTKVHVIENGNDGGVLMNSIHFHDSQIVKGITFQKLATSPDAHQAKNAGEVHQDVLNSPVHYLKNELVTMDLNDLLIPLVIRNYGPTARKYVPKPNLGRTDPEDLANLLIALGTAFEKGGLHWSMLPEIWADWGLPRVNIEEWMADMKAKRGGAPSDADSDPAAQIASALTKTAGKGAEFSSKSEAASQSLTIENVLSHMPENLREWGREMLESMVENSKEANSG
jgi:hypothetical protein